MSAPQSPALEISSASETSSFHLQRQVQSPSRQGASVSPAIDPAIAPVQSVTISSQLKSSQNDTFGNGFEAKDSAGALLKLDSPRARISEEQTSRYQHAHLHSDNARPMPSQASCSRKLQLDDDAQDLHAITMSTHPCSDFSATNECLCKPNCASPSAAVHSAEQIAALEVAVSHAAAAQEKEAINAWISVQAQELSVTDSLPSSLLQESLEQRLEQQKVWGMINSTILSDLMKSLGSKSIFHH
jgi:hypothetical protein